MKLLNYATAYFAALLLLVLLVWAGLFYYNMLDEIYDSMDDGLENQKMLVLRQVARDPAVLQQREFENGYYKVKELPLAQARNRPEIYLDTLMYMYNEKDFEPVRMLKTVFRHQDRYYELRLITSMVEEDDLISDLLYSLLWLYLGLLGSILLLNNVLLRQIWRPFYQLLKALKKFRLNEPQPLPPAKSRISEFRLLHDTLDQVLQSQVQVFTSQKTFIENAAHELQTPLAISLNKLELLADSPHLQQEQVAELAVVTGHLQRLTRLNKSLLLLSKIENQQFGPEEEVNLNALVGKATEDFGDQLAHRQIRFELQEKAACQVRMNPDLASILVLNLVKNALQHNHPGGFIRISLGTGSLRVENSGPNQPLDGRRLFTRFYQGSPAGGGTGLGLAIVKAIADRYHFRLRYDFKGFHVMSLHFSYPFP